MKPCLECGEKTLGREDKKFCSDSCRSTYNNRANKDAKNFMRKINSSLRRNYRILAELNTSGETTTSREKLANKGFNFDYCTGVRSTKKGQILYYLYDQAYQNLSGDDFLLIRKRL